MNTSDVTTIFHVIPDTITGSLVLGLPEAIILLACVLGLTILVSYLGLLVSKDDLPGSNWLKGTMYDNPDKYK